MAELGEFTITNENKVHVDIDMLDYDYINKCNDSQKLRAIVEVLKSGKEGYYPDLTEKAEQKWLSSLSEKERNRILRMRQQATPDEIQQADEDLSNWQNEISQLDAEIKTHEKVKIQSQKVPPVRGTKREVLNVPNKNNKQELNEESKSKKSSRLSGYDFPAWEKFDVDAAVQAIDEEESEINRQKQKNREEGLRLAQEAKMKRKKRHQEELENIRKEMKFNGLSELQRKTMAVREKQKGNEAFKANELEEAFVFYSRSLALDNTVATVYANRAMVSIRLEKLETGEDDATHALELDPNHMKALSRRGLARLKLGKTKLAIEDFQKALDLKPGNDELIQLLTKAKAKYREVEGKEYIPDSQNENLNTQINKNNKNENDNNNNEVININFVSSLNQLLLPNHKEFIQSGKLNLLINESKSENQKFTRMIIQESDEEDNNDHNDNNDNNNNNREGKKENFTRITIQESDDDEEENNDHNNNNNQQNFTRVPIQIDSDSEEENDDEKQKSESNNDKNDNNSFTRIQISMDSDSEEEKEENEQEVKKLSLEEIENEALILKEKGNTFMQSSDYINALKCYNESLELSPNGPHSNAVLTNRALTHLQLKNYQEVINDTSLVLSQTPNNLKALYRRAVAYESLSNVVECQKDINKILELDPKNQLAIKTNERLQNHNNNNQSPLSSLKANIPSIPTPSDESTESSTSTSSDWGIEVMKKAALKHLENGKLENAINVLEKALSNSSSGKTNSDQILSLQQLLASTYASLENHEKSFEISELILKQDSNNFKALLRATDSAIHLNNLSKAKEYVSRALRLDPINSDARSLMDTIQEKENPSNTSLPITQSSSTQLPSSPTKQSPLTTLPSNIIEESLNKKNLGNDAMKLQQYEEAIKYYTEAIELDSSNMMFYNNRSQAYLKLGDYINAINDSTIVIESNPRLPNLKALFRRALGYKGLNTKESLTNSLNDLNIILKAEPANKEAKLEKNKIQVILQNLILYEKQKEEERKLKEESERLKLLSISNEKLVDDSGIVARSTKIIKSNKIDETQLREVNTTPKKEKELINEKTISNNSEILSTPISVPSSTTATPSSTPIGSISTSTTPIKVNSTNSTPQNKSFKQIKIQPNVPSESPRNLYEFEKNWRNLKNHPKLFLQYFLQFNKKTLKMVFQSELSLDILSYILRILNQFSNEITSDKLIFILNEILKITKFSSIVLNLLNDEDKNNINECIKYLERNQAIDDEKARQYRIQYQI